MRLRRILLLVPALVFPVLVGGCSPLPGFFLPAGPVASQDRHLFLIVVALLMVVALPVFIGLPWILWRFRRGNAASSYRPQWDFSWPFEIAAWGVPIVIVAVLGWFTWNATHRLDPYHSIGKGDPVEVQAIALDWKWLFIYPQQGVASVNRLVLPTGRPVHIDLTSDTVMQSLLIPRLAGQIYAMAGMRTQLNLMASAPGRYNGANTQYNGNGFSRQSFAVNVIDDRAFTHWLADARSAGQPLDAYSYRKLAARSVIDRPMTLAPVAPHLFADVIARYHPTGPKPTPKASGGEP